MLSFIVIHASNYDHNVHSQIVFIYGSIISINGLLRLLISTFCFKTFSSKHNKKLQYEVEGGVSLDDLHLHLHCHHRQQFNPARRRRYSKKSHRGYGAVRGKLSRLSGEEHSLSLAGFDQRYTSLYSGGCEFSGK